jgi:hypothetical protein
VESISPYAKNGEARMKLSLIIGSLIFTVSLPLTSDARKWRVRLHDLASEYSQIIDQRPGNEVVVVYWIAPETMDANMANVEAVKAMLREHMLVGIVHGSAAQAGRLDFRVPENPVLEDGERQQRQPLAKENWPPMITAYSALLQKFLSQSLGQLGGGFHWFVFDGKGIDSCGKGSFWIQYAGERYSYVTPIPGCSATSGAPR